MYRYDVQTWHSGMQRILEYTFNCDSMREALDEAEQSMTSEEDITRIVRTGRATACRVQ